MCGRFSLTTTPDAVAEHFSLTELDPFPPRYNIAPTQPILVIRKSEPDMRPRNASGRFGQLARWGLIPGWAKDPATLPLFFNARSETAHERNAFKGALRYRRCLVPASGFYEWRRAGREKPEPFFLKPRGEGPVAFAGLAETFLAADGSEIDTAAILTVGANASLSAIHERMPVLIEPADFERWLDCREFEPAAIADLLRPARDDAFEIVAVSDRVNAVANMGPDVQKPLNPDDPPPPTPPAAQGSLF
ncbi:SOS response-associated peptidase [Aureimonas pseudogalii]|uniref:Abasic site processing protein n=1 Tax=Aureimonas pseudogalii TaxID=1744844 RepID=A0A7W6H5H9_9HYPH|nr:SOS response-associated peptidase [Aureimonas pseudogalii]MBB3998916.1 putative SOS response-associated peptidase YedK [Aureimonas pseudogalii]